MMKKLLVFGLMILLCGCSCSTNIKPTPTPSSTPETTPTPAPTESTDSSLNQNDSAGNGQDLLDYLSGKYTLHNPAPIEQLDGNAKEGYMFGYNNADFYLLRFDRSNTSASQWMDEAVKNGYIEVKIGNQMKKLYAVVNQDYMLLYETDDLDSGFKDYFENYDPNGTESTVN